MVILITYAGFKINTLLSYGDYKVQLRDIKGYYNET